MLTTESVDQNARSPRIELDVLGVDEFASPQIGDGSSTE